jgi:hypothetical protein
MTTAHRLSAALVLMLPALAAQAAGHIKPGLWEQTMEVKSDNPQANAAMAQMKERLAAMSPAQREAMEKAMAGRGVNMGGAPNTMRVCITKEQAERDVTPDRNGHCQRTDVVRSGNTVRFSFACTTERSSVTGKGVFTQVSDSAYTVATDADMALHGAPSHVHTDIAARFVSGDCGGVKPVEAPPAR